MIDCDVHNDWATTDDLLPYLNQTFREYMLRGELPGPHGVFPKGQRRWFHPEGFVRRDICASSPDHPGSDYENMREKLLDLYDYDYAILLGEHPRIVQVLVSSGSQRPYGDPFYHPIWEAAAEYDLVIAAHLGGQGGVNAHSISNGPTTFFWETYALLCETAMTHVASLIAHGVFEKWSNLTFVGIECGVAWLPGVLWRLDADYKALRKETPWLKRLPSEYAHDHIRLTTQPLEQPENKQHLWDLLEGIDGKNTLLFSSDYPHWDFDDPNMVALPPEWMENIFDANARKVYRKLPPLNGKKPSFPKSISGSASNGSA